MLCQAWAACSGVEGRQQHPQQCCDPQQQQSWYPQQLLYRAADVLQMDKGNKPPLHHAEEGDWVYVNKESMCRHTAQCFTACAYLFYNVHLTVVACCSLGGRLMSCACARTHDPSYFV